MKMNFVSIEVNNYFIKNSPLPEYLFGYRITQKHEVINFHKKEITIRKAQSL